MSPYFFTRFAQTMGDELVGNWSGNITSDCPEGNQVIWTTFEQCIYTPLQWVSFAVGMASMLFWFGVLMPQIIDNCKDMKGVASISAGLLFSWIFGDTTNLVGAFLTKQGLFQVLLGVWFVMTDLILSSQLIYYHCVFKKREQAPKERTEPKQLLLCIAVLMCMSVGFSGVPGSILPQSAARPAMVGGRHLLSTDLSSKDDAFLQSLQEIIGYALGIVSTVAYFTSRSFQIYKNVKYRNVKGLSTVTFAMAVMGNFLYGLAIVLYSVELHYSLLHLPWLLGSWGIMFMDCLIVFQIKAYGKDEERTMLIVEDPAEEEVRPLINPINCDTPTNDVYGAIYPGRVVV